MTKPIKIADISAYRAAIRAHDVYCDGDKTLLNSAIDSIERDGITIEAAANQIGVSATTLVRVFSGNYAANPNNVLVQIENWLRLRAERSMGKRAGYIHTDQSSRIWRQCDLARTYQRIVSIYGATQIGKTTSLKEYARTHKDTIYIYAPVKATPIRIVTQLARALGVIKRSSINDMIDAIQHKITDRHLVIVDEAHQMVMWDKSARIDAIEFLRVEIFDVCKCGVILCGTNVWSKAFGDSRWGEALRQTSERGWCDKLEDEPTQGDIDAFIAYYNLPTPDSKMSRHLRLMGREHGLGRMSTIFTLGSRLAGNRGESMAWSHFIEADSALPSSSMGRM